MPEYRFETHQPVNLVVEISKGNVNVRCIETDQSTVVVEGKHAEDVVVEQHGDSITVTEPGRGRIFGDTTLRVDVVVPERSNPAVRTGSADIQIEGRAGHAQLRSGSGDCTVGGETFFQPIAQILTANDLTLLTTGTGTLSGDTRSDLPKRMRSGN
jgi:hypothetical protein